MKAIKVIFAICCGLIIAACGGGGGGDGSSSSPADFSGTWSTNNGGTVVVSSIVQTGSTLNLTRITPPLPGLKGIGVVSGSTASVTIYINNVQQNTQTWTLINANAASSRLDSCTPTQGYICNGPVGSTLVLTR